MRYTPLTLALITAVGVSLGFGCKKELTAAEQLEKVEAESRSATQEMANYTFKERARFVAKMEAQLDALNKNLDELAAKIDTSSEAIQSEAKPQLETLRDQARKLGKHLEEVRTANESTWDGFKASSENAYNSLKEGFQKSRQWVSDKIAP